MTETRYVIERTTLEITNEGTDGMETIATVDYCNDEERCIWVPSLSGACRWRDRDDANSYIENWDSDESVSFRIVPVRVTIEEIAENG